MMNKKYTRHLSMIVISGFLLGIGCSMLVKGAIGSDAMTTLMEGIHIASGYSISTCNLIINMSLFILSAILDKKSIGFGSIMFPLITTLGIMFDSAIPLIGQGVIYSIFYYSFGILLMCLAIALNSKCECGKNPYDALCFSLSEKMNIRYNIVRMICDGLMLISGIILHGTFGIGTIISIFGIGNIAVLLMKYICNSEFYISFMMLEKKL